MKSLWPESFEENALPSAKEILEEQARLLAGLTGDIVVAELVKVKKPPTRASMFSDPPKIPDPLDKDFRYNFYLVGKFLDKYRFKVLSFAHDIPIYPVIFVLDRDLGKELGLETPEGCIAKVGDPGGVESLLEGVLRSNRIRNVVSSIIKLSK